MNDQHPIDRRMALRRAATAGTIAWTAPTLLSRTVSAGGPVGPCTPKCAPQFSTGTALTVRQVCFATCFDRRARPIELVSSFSVSITTLPNPCTDGSESTIATSEGTVSNPTCIID